MKKIFKLIICVLSIMFMMAFKSYRAKIVPLAQLKTQPITEIPVQITTSKLKIDLMSHQQFLNDMGS